MTTQVLSQSISEKVGLIIFPRISLRKIWIFGFILITALLILYIFQVSEFTKEGFYVSQGEKEIAKITETNKSLEIVLSQENSLVNLEALLSRLNYEKVDKINYIKVMDGKVVARPK